MDWIRHFVADEIEPLDLAFGGEELIYDKSSPVYAKLIRPLQQKVRDKGLWSCHLTPEFGGQGYGQVRLAYMAEILGRSSFAASIFGTQAPDSGNAEILAHYGTASQRETFLAPLLDGRISSCYAMTEPQGSSMFLVPAGTPGMEIIRRTGLGLDPAGYGNHSYVRYSGVRVPAEHLLGGEGQAFTIAQTRLGGGRLHHAMRTVGAVGRCLDMLCERVLSRTTQGELLGRKQMVQGEIADVWIELTQFRLQVLHAAWCVDTRGAHAARREIAAVKVATPKVFQDAVLRTMHLHGALGVSNEMPLAGMLLGAVAMGIADGPTEVHKITLARQVLKDYSPSKGAWPSEHLPERRAAARRQFADVLSET